MAYLAVDKDGTKWIFDIILTQLADIKAYKEE